MVIRSDGPQYDVTYPGHHIVVRNGGKDGRRHEDMDGYAHSGDGVVGVLAWRWLDPHPRYPRPGDLDQRGHFMTVLPDGTTAREFWTRTPRSRITTTAGLARVARAWLKRVRAEWQARP